MSCINKNPSLGWIGFIAYNAIAYKHVTSTTSYTYSNKLIEKIVIDITNDPDLFVKYKEQIKKD